MTSSRAPRPTAPSRFARLPVERVSITVTRSPRSTRASTRFDPMKPAPPVTTQSIIAGAYERRVVSVALGMILRYPAVGRRDPAGFGMLVAALRYSTQDPVRGLGRSGGSAIGVEKTAERPAENALARFATFVVVRLPTDTTA